MRMHDFSHALKDNNNSPKKIAGLKKLGSSLGLAKMGNSRLGAVIGESRLSELNMSENTDNEFFLHLNAKKLAEI